MRYDFWEKERDEAKVTVAGLKVLTTDAPVITAKIWRPKATKPSAHYRFGTIERRDQFIANYEQSFTDELGRKAERKAARKGTTEQQASVKVGDIFSSSWGYDQTNIDYYEVVKRTACTVTLRKVAQRSEGEHISQDRVFPVKGEYISGPRVHRLQFSKYGPSVTLTSYSSASPYEGGGRMQTASGWGH